MAGDGTHYGEHAVAEIKTYRETFDLDEEWLGILIAPWFDEDRGVPQIQINVRAVDGPYASPPGVETGRQYGYQQDLAYTFSGERMADVIDEIYPAMVEEIEEAFPAAQVEYESIVQD